MARWSGCFVGILFSFSAADKLQVFCFPADRSADITQVLDFAATYLGGGTSYQRPLSPAGELLAEEFKDTTRARGDILMLTDDDCGVTETWLRHRIEENRTRPLSLGSDGAHRAR